MSTPATLQAQEAMPATGSPPAGYAPSTNRHARRLIAQIQRDPSDEEAVRALESYYQEARDYPSLANLMEGWAGVLRDERKAADAYAEAAEAVLVGLGDRGRARHLFELALNRNAQHQTAMTRLQTLLEGEGEYLRLKQRLQYVAHSLAHEGGDSEYLASVHQRLGQLYQHRLSSPGRASLHYRKALEINPHLLPAIVGARELYRQVDNYKAVAILYELEVGALHSPAQRQQRLCELAQVQREELGDLDRAIRTLRRALRLLPSSVSPMLALADAVAARAALVPEAAAVSDRKRAAELYFQLAKRVPRSQARAHLARALSLEPDHAGAQHMRAGLADQSADSDPPMLPLESAGSAVNDWLSSAEPEPQDRNPLADSLAPIGGAEGGPSEFPPPPEPRLGQSSPAWQALQQTHVDLEGRTAAARPAPLPDQAPNSAPTTRAPRKSAAALRARLHASARLAEPAPESDSRAGLRAPSQPAAQQISTPTSKKPRARLIDAPGLEPDPARMPLEINLGPTTDNNLYVGFSNSLLEGGLFVTTYTPYPVGTPLDLLVTLPGGFETRVYGQVGLVREALDFAQDVPGMLITFETMTREGLSLLERFASRRTPTFFDWSQPDLRSSSPR